MIAEKPPIALELVCSPSPMERWLWCLHCERFFQVRNLRYDFQRIERCAFDDCGGAGLDKDIFLWDDWRNQNDPRWPATEADLNHGMRSPETASLCQALARQSTSAFITGFARSPELRALVHQSESLGSRPPRWSEELIEKLAWWGKQPVDVDGAYLGKSLREFGDWIACRATDAGEITAELAAFFRYGARVHHWPHGGACALFLSDPAVTEELARCIRIQRRRWRR